MGFLHIWKEACEVKHFNVHQDSFLNTAMSLTGHKESALQESVKNSLGKSYLQIFVMRRNYLITPFRAFSLPSFHL